MVPTEAEYVLHGEDRQVGNRGRDAADQVPVGTVAVSTDIVEDSLALLRLEFFEPPDRSVVVMSPSVGNSVLD